VPRLVALLKPSKSRNVSVSVQSAALQVIGNVACGDDRQTQVIIDCDALPCLKALLSSNDRGIRKEVCWISSNITESSHQVQAVLDAGILPPLLKLLESQDSACREDATWVLYNISSNHDMRQISYLAEQHGIRALCNLLTCAKDLDVLWKGCGTVAAVALKGLRNILVAGQQEAIADANGYNRMAALVAEAHGVERIEALTNHQTMDVRQRARLLLERFFGAEQPPSSPDSYSVPDDHTNKANAAAAAAVAAAASAGNSLAHVSSSHFHDSEVAAAAAAAISDPAAFAAAAAAASSGATCSCPHPHDYFGGDGSHHLSLLAASSNCESDSTAAVRAHYRATAVVAAAAAATGYNPQAFQAGVMEPLMAMSSGGPGLPQLDNRLLQVGVDVDGPSSTGFSSASSTDSDPEDDDSDSDLLPPPPAPCKCLLCLDTTPLADRRPRKLTSDAILGPTTAFGGSNVATISDSEATLKLPSLAAGTVSPARSTLIRADPDHLPSSRKGPNTALKQVSVQPLVMMEDSCPGNSPPDRETCASDVSSDEPARTLCEFCSGGGRLGDGKAGLAAKLGRAVRLGHSHCVAILLSRMTWSQRVAATEAPALLHPGGGPPDGGVSSSLPAVVLAAHLGKPDCLALLLRRCRPDLDVTHGKKRLTPLAWAAHKGYFRCSALLIEHGANTAAKCGEGLTALHLAASGGGHLSICKLLLDRNAPVNARSSKKQTPLCLATQKGYSRLVRVLLEHGADFNNEDEGKFTPLHIAASNGFTESADELIKAGSRIDCKTRTGITPLHYAVQGGHTGVVKLLVAAGAKVNCTWKPLLIIAADDGNREVVQILLDALAAIDCRANIKAKLDKDTEIHDKLTPLHLASSKGHKDVVELLLRRGAAVDATTEKGTWTALDFSVLNGHSVCAMLLLEYGATVTENAKSAGQTGWTLVQHAAHNGHKDLVRMLIQRLQLQKLKAKNGAPSDVGSRTTDVGVRNTAGTDLATSHGSGKGSAVPPSNGESEGRFSPPSPLSLTSADHHAPYGSKSFTASNGNLPVPDDSRENSRCESGHHPSQSSSSLNSSMSRCLIREPSGNVGLGPGVEYAPGNAPESRSVYHGALSANRYDPRAPEGDESCFIPGQNNDCRTEVNGFGTTSVSSDFVDNLSATANIAPGSRNTARRRVPKDDRAAASRQRERERKRREAEASEARERLEEAVAQRSVTKLTEAIAHVSKLVLHLATSVNADGNMPVGAAGGLTGDVIEDAYNMPMSVAEGSASGSGVGNVGAMNSQLTSGGALSIEVGLGNEVQKARKILAGLQAEERRAKEERAREAQELRRDNSQQLILKAIGTVLEGGDVRALTRTVNRAKRIILDEDDPIVSEASRIGQMINDAEKADLLLKSALRRQDIASLRSAIETVDNSVNALRDANGLGAAVRVFDGKDPGEILRHAQDVCENLVKQRENAVAKQEVAKAQQDAAIRELSISLESGDLHVIERALEVASALLLSKESEESNVIEAAKKVFSKALKVERRKLRQANSTKDVIKIDAAVKAGSALRVSALALDLETSIELSAKLCEQDTVRFELTAAIKSGDEQAIRQMRSRLDALGMFAEAESARAELDNLQRVARVRSLLLSAIQDADDSVEKFRSLNTFAEKVMWTWPDGQRLCDLVKRSRGKFGGSLDKICDEVDKVAAKLSAAGRDALLVTVADGDTRELAAAIAGYERSFVQVDIPAMFGQQAGRDLLAKANDRLSYLQAKEQEKVKAEAAQVKTEYVLANSRRSAARTRGSRRARNTVQPLRTESVASTNSSECGEEDVLDSETTFSPQCGDVSGRAVASSVRVNGVLSNLLASIEADCSHFYLWKEGTTVQCGRCGNIRESLNADWLQRVKKRGTNVPPETTPPGILQGDGISTGPVSGRANLSGSPAVPNNVAPASQYSSKPRPGAFPSSSSVMSGQTDRHVHRPGVSARSTALTFAGVSSTMSTGYGVDSNSISLGMPVGMGTGPVPSMGLGTNVSGPPVRYMLPPRDGVYRVPPNSGIGMRGHSHGLPASSMLVAASSNATAGSGFIADKSGLGHVRSGLGVGGGVPGGTAMGMNSCHVIGYACAGANDGGGINVGAAPTRRENNVSHSMGHLGTPAGGGHEEHVAGVRYGGNVGIASDEFPGGSADLGVDFANENFGFDIDSLLITDGDK
jgi:ankyrin repeat protein